MRWLLQRTVSFSTNFSKFRHGFGFIQTCGLVNVKLKWVKDKELDAVVAREKHLKAVCNLVSIISSSHDSKAPIFHLNTHRGQLGLPQELKLAAFIRRYPNIFVEHCCRDGAGTRVPCFGLTPEAIELYSEETVILREGYDRRQLVERHPLVDIREKFANMMSEGRLDRSRGMYRKSVEDDLGKKSGKIVYPDWSEEEEEEESENYRISRYDSDCPVVEDIDMVPAGQRPRWQ
ncbi:hypothetical protein F2Q68_00036478 [Brassica cretica]|uniref:PORR domain-containing protein n=1 Tax=Brassica cretica TaxID=69181 RepID=A0A8S9H151_BRACR|nr:hypothetical protein F2Q68_00036478 [Brassica cretica]